MTISKENVIVLQIYEMLFDVAFRDIEEIGIYYTLQLKMVNLGKGQIAVICIFVKHVMVILDLGDNCFSLS